MDAKTFLKNFSNVADAPGGVQRLRGLVLNLAVSGQLLTQRPEDETVARLIERIDADRPSGETPPDSAPLASGPFELPDTWCWLPLKRLVHLEMGQSPPSSAYNQSGDGMPFFQGKADFGRTYPTPRYWCTAPTKVAQPGDVLVSVRAPVGPTNIADQVCCIGRGLAALRPLGGMPTRFIRYLMQAFERDLAALGTGTTFIAISKKSLGPFPMPVPPLAEQERIVAKVDELMRLLDDLEHRQEHSRQVATLLRGSALHAVTSSETPGERAKAWGRVATNWTCVTSGSECAYNLEWAVRALAVQGALGRQDPRDEPADLLLERTILEREQLLGDRLTRLVPDTQSHQRPDDLPAGWVWAPLQDLVRFIDYRGRTPTKTTTGVPLITAKNIRRGHISETPREYIAEGDFDRWMTRGLPRVGDVLFTTEAPMGNAALIREDRRFALAQRTITLAPYADFSGAFLEIVLLSPWFQAELAHRATGMTATGIKAAKLRLIRIPVPPREEQDRIVLAVSDLLRRVADLGRALERSTQAAESVAAVLTMADRTIV